VLHFVFICRVQCYINYGWDQHLVDPDKGANIRCKLAAVQHPKSLTSKLLCSFPNEDDPQWTNRLYKTPEVSFSTIYDFLVDRKVLLKRVSYLESVADKRAEEIQGHTERDCDVVNASDSVDKNEERPNLASDMHVPVEYTRTLDKAYRFIKMVTSKRSDTTQCLMYLAIFVFQQKYYHL